MRKSTFYIMNQDFTLQKTKEVKPINSISMYFLLDITANKGKMLNRQFINIFQITVMIRKNYSQSTIVYYNNKTS